MPWIAIDSGPDIFYAGLMWSGAWSLDAQRTTLGIELTLGLPSMSTGSDHAIEGPHAFFGVARGDLRAASSAVRTFVMAGVRGGRPLDALVTYNTWFAYGTRIDEDEDSRGDGRRGRARHRVVRRRRRLVRRRRTRRASSTLRPASAAGRSTPSASPKACGRSPTTRTSVGMKFGIWVEPERVAPVDRRTDRARAGIVAGKERRQLRIGGDSAQMCLASAQARQWVLDAGHARSSTKCSPTISSGTTISGSTAIATGTHTAQSDGNFAHVTGLYDVLAQLRARYPELLIENVSGGGNRLDLGMMRYSDVGWMDDRSAPSVHVRHILGGLSAIFRRRTSCRS